MSIRARRRAKPNLEDRDPESRWVLVDERLYIFHRLRKERLVTERDLLRSIGLGALLHTPLVLGAQATGRSFVRWFHF